MTDKTAPAAAPRITSGLTQEAARADAAAFDQEVSDYLAKLPERFKREDGRTVAHEDDE